MLKWIEAVREESSRSGKEYLLSQMKDVPMVLELVKLAHDPMITFGVKEFEAGYEGSVSWQDVYEHFISLTEELSNRTLSGDVALGEIKGFFQSLDAEAQKLYTLILKKDFGWGVGIKTLNKVFGKDFIPEFTVQLANPYSSLKDYKVSHWYVSPKLDGMRGFWKNGVLFSRNGKEISISEELKAELKHAQELLMCDWMDGELIHKNRDFYTTMSIARSDYHPQKDELQFWVFACGGGSQPHDTLLMTNRLSQLHLKRFSRIIVVPQLLCLNTKEEISRYLSEYTSQGWEGIMLRHPTTSYDWKRSDTLLKLKPELEEDVRVVDIELGTGRLNSTVGALICHTKENKVVKVGSGLTDELRTYWLNWSASPTKTFPLIEIKYQELTPDGEFRFPRYHRLKEEE